MKSSKPRSAVPLPPPPIDSVLSVRERHDRQSQDLMAPEPVKDHLKAPEPIVDVDPAKGNELLGRLFKTRPPIVND